MASKNQGTFELAIDVDKIEKQFDEVVFSDDLEECAERPLHEQPSFADAKAYAALYFMCNRAATSLVLHSLRGCGGLTPMEPFFSTTAFYRDGTWQEVARLEKPKRLPSKEEAELMEQFRTEQ